MTHYLLHFSLLTIIFQSSLVYAEVKPLRLHLSYYPTVASAGVYIAQERGWYKDAGLDLQLVFKDLNISQNLIADIADVAIHSGHEIIRQVAMGHDLKAFAVEYQRNPLSLAANASIKKLSDLKGKTIGLFTDQEKDFIRVMFASEGMSLDQIHFKKIHSFTVNDLLGFLKTKKYDAIPVWAFNHPVAFALKGYNTQQYPSYRYGFHFYGTAYYAKTATIQNRKEELAKLVHITRRGWMEAFKNPEKTAKEFMSKWYPKDQLIDNNYDLTLKQQIIQMKLIQGYLYEGVSPNGFGEMTPFQWRTSLKLAIRDKLI